MYTLLCECFDERRPYTGPVHAAGEAFVCSDGNQSPGSALPSKPIRQFYMVYGCNLLTASTDFTHMDKSTVLLTHYPCILCSAMETSY